MTGTYAPGSGYVTWQDDDDIIPEMGLRKRWVWFYAGATLLLMCGMGCVMAGAGMGEKQTPTTPVQKDSRQMLTPDRKPVQRPVEGL